MTREAIKRCMPSTGEGSGSDWHVVFVGLALVGVVLGITFAAPAHAVSITATASGSETPAQVVAPGHTINGDFRIFSNLGPGVVGDGADEETDWIFDFTTDANYGGFAAAPSLASATLELTLKPITDIFSDGVAIYPLNVFGGTATIAAVAFGGFSTIQIDLLEFNSSSDILGTLGGTHSAGGLTAGSGELFMRYVDDAIISGASLTLTSVPEPSALVLLGIGLAGMRRRKAA